MKWYTHQTLGSALALSCGATPIYFPVILVGCVLPDMIDHALTRGNKSLWRKIHRQSSHWIGWYVLLACFGWLLLEQIISLDPKDFSNLYQALGLKSSLKRQLAQASPDFLAQACLWLSFGSICHILMDALTPMRVPISPLGGKQRWGYALVSTGTWQEYVFLGIAVGILALLGLKQF